MLAEPQRNRSSPGDASYGWMGVVVLLLLGAGYLLQLSSPLRINTDAYRLLSMAVSASRGEGYQVDGHADLFPRGYPFLVRLLLQVGVASSRSLVVVNLLCLLAGVAALYTWCRERGRWAAMTAIAFTLSSWVMVKHVTLPLTELPYLATSSAAVFFAWRFHRQHGGGKWGSLLLGGLFAWLAIQCRTVGVTLLPVLALVPLWHPDLSPRRARAWRERWWPATAGILGLLVVAAWTVWHRGGRASGLTSRAGYLGVLWHAFRRDGFVATVLHDFRYRVLEFGEIFANVPASKAGVLLPLLYAAGLAAWVVALYGAWRMLRDRDMVVLPLYFLSYTAVMALWPYYDARFWLPLLPVLAVLVLSALDRLAARCTWGGALRGAYLAGFVALGLVALAFSTRISLAGRQFSEVYGDGTTRMTYRCAFHNGLPVDRSRVNPSQVRLLRIFDPLAAPETDPDKPPWSPPSD